MPHVIYAADAHLIAALRNGDERAFDRLYEKHFPKLFQFLRKICKSRETAEDLAHEVFMKVWGNRHQLDADRCFSAYLFTIARNQLWNHLRKQEVNNVFLKEIKPGLPVASNSTEEIITFTEYLSLYEQALTGLSQQKRRIFLLNRQEGKSYREIAAQLETSEKNVEFHIRDCLKTLKRYFNLHADVAVVLLLGWLL